MLKKDIPKVRQLLASGKYLAIPENTYKSLVKKSQAPQGFNDEELKRAVIVKADEIDLC